MLRRLLLLCLVTVFLSVITGPLEPSSAVMGVTTTTVATPAASVGVDLIELKAVNSPCADVVFVGARGSGEDYNGDFGMGRNVASVMELYANGLAGRRLAYWAVTYPAYAVENLVLANTRARYFQGLDSGASEVLGLLTHRHQMCPRERYVLSGYSQGAMVMHRALWNFTARGLPYSMLDGVIAIGDGDRIGTQGGIALDTAGRTGRGVTWVFRNISGAVATGAYHPHYQALPRSPANSNLSRWVSICINGDLVCDTDLAHVARGKRYHEMYAGRPSLATAAAWVARRTMSLPATPAMSFSDANPPPITAGQPYRYQFVAQGGVAPYTYTAGALDSGLSLSQAGVLSGTLRSPNIDGRTFITVRARDARGQVVPRSVVITELDPGDPSSPPPFRSVTAGTDHACGIRSDASAWCWGSNAYGQLGTAGQDAMSPTRVVQGQWKSVDAGAYHTCGVTIDASGWCWGRNDRGQLGDGTTQGSGLPLQVPGAWSSIVAGATHSCGIRTDGSGWCWGDNHLGELGNGTREAATSLVRLPGTWRSLSTGLERTCGVMTDGSGWCWGSGPVGNGTGPSSENNSPVHLAGSWSSLTAGGETCGVRSDNSGWCWGSEDYGNSYGSSYEPQQLPGTWSSFDAAGDHVCGFRPDGSLWCWGDNNLGQLANGAHGWVKSALRLPQTAGFWTSVSTSTGNTCATTAGREVRCWGSAFSPKQDFTSPANVVPGTWVSGDAGGGHTCAVDTEGQANCWGSNESGQIGDGGQLWATRPTSVIGSWRSVSASSRNTCGVRTDASGWCWGDNTYRQIADGDGSPLTTPTQIAGSWTTITTGNTGACGVRTDASAWCWGTDDTWNAHRPATQVAGNWASVQTAADTTCGVHTDGSGWCWGSNDAGQLGNGTYVDSADPVQVPGSWKVITPAFRETCGIRTDDSAWCWGGFDPSHTVVPGSLGRSSTPTQIPGQWSSLTPGSQATCGTHTDGSGWCWGSPGRYPSTGWGLQQIAGSWLSFTFGDQHLCAITTAQDLTCWGSDLEGQRATDTERWVLYR